VRVIYSWILFFLFLATINDFGAGFGNARVVPLRKVACLAKRLLLVPNGDGDVSHIGMDAPSFEVKSIELIPGTYEVGRVADSAEIVLPIGTVSGRHAMLCLDENQKLSVTDLGSTNGTFVNGEELKPMNEVPVELGSEVVFGDNHLASFLFVQEDYDSGESE